MYITGFVGIIATTSCLAAMTAEYAGTKNQVGNGFGIFFMFLYLAFQGYVHHPHTLHHSSTNPSRTFCDTTMYLYVSEIFPTEIRPIGMGFSLLGQFTCEYNKQSHYSVYSPHLTTTPATIILLQTAPMGFNNAGWKYYLVIICFSAAFIPGMHPLHHLG